MEIREVIEADEKSGICGAVLRALPKWFGNPAAIEGYVAEAREKPFYGAFDNGAPVGFVCIKTHNEHTAEIYVMGVLEAYHRLGTGRRFVSICESFCVERKMEFLTVKTLDGSDPDVNYRKTRLFYTACGFVPLEVFPLYWDKDNPCLFLAKHIKL